MADAAWIVYFPGIRLQEARSDAARCASGADGAGGPRWRIQVVYRGPAVI
jgi:hypothetical protein